MCHWFVGAPVVRAGSWESFWPLGSR